MFKGLATTLLSHEALIFGMKGGSLVDACIVFAALQFVILFPEGVRNLIRWENQTLGGSYFTGVLMIVLCVFVVVFRKYELHEIGVSTENWRRSVNYGGRGWVFFIIPQCILSYILAWGVSYQESMELSGLLIVVIFIASFLMVRRKEAKPASNKRLVLFGSVLVFPLVLRLLYSDLPLRVLKEYLWNIVVGGFVEEFFYRGYIQSSINLEYGTNWKIGKINFGPGLLISSLLFGLSRGLRTMKPWRGVYSVSWSWSFFAFAVGFFYGLIRESSGDIIGSGTANSMIDAIGEALVS